MFLRRSDAYLRNEWSNYNFAYKDSVPNDIGVPFAYNVDDDPLIFEKATLELRRKTVEKSLTIDDILEIGPRKKIQITHILEFM